MAQADISKESLRELLDRMAIQDLYYNYAELVDFGNNHRIAKEIFAPDGVADFGTVEIRGFEALHDFYSNSPIFTKYPKDLDGLRHDIDNVRVRFDGPDKAQSSARVMAYHWHVTERAAGLSRPADLVIAGMYQDEMVRTPDGWRIARRRGGQFGTGIAAGKPPEAMKALFAGMLGRIPSWDGKSMETPFVKIK